MTTTDELWQDLLDKDDRNSPAEYPDMILITREEFEVAVTVGGGQAQDEIERLRGVIRALSEGKQSTFRQRGKEVGIEADDGEKCWIIHSELIHAAEVAAGLV